jgi:hypothetical protein
VFGGLRQSTAGEGRLLPTFQRIQLSAPIQVLVGLIDSVGNPRRGSWAQGLCPCLWVGQHVVIPLVRRTPWGDRACGCQVSRLR